MTVQACWSDPINDSNSLQVHDFRRSHCESVSRSLFNFSSDNLSSWLIVSMVIPKSVIVVSGPFCFSWAKGEPPNRCTLYEEFGDAQHRFPN